MKVKLINNFLYKDIPVDTLLDTISGMEVDSEGIFNIPGGMCYLCKTPSGSLKYVLATSVEIVDESNIDWEQVRIQAAVSAMSGMFACINFDPYKDDITRLAVIYADALIEKLKNKQK